MKSKSKHIGQQIVSALSKNLASLNRPNHVVESGNSLYSVDATAPVTDKTSALINRHIIDFFNHHTSIIEDVFQQPNSLQFSIILKKDNQSNRETLFDFLHQYDLLPQSLNYPAIFQFIPSELSETWVQSDMIKVA